MDTERFDALTRRLATPTSRRTVLRGVAATAATGLLGLLGARETIAEKPPCLDFCREFRQGVHDDCSMAGPGAFRAFTCPPHGLEGGGCFSSSYCVDGWGELPAGRPADASLCQRERAACEATCTAKSQFKCNPAIGESYCACYT